MTTPNYLAIDPGVSTGYATFDSKGTLLSKGILRSLDELMDFLQEQSPIDTIICEDYRVYGHKAKAHTGSRVETVQAIGMVKVYANKWGAKLVLQPASILPIAQKFSGINLPSNHKLSHDFAALNHGIYYLTKEGILQSRVLKENKGGIKND